MAHGSNIVGIRGGSGVLARLSSNLARNAVARWLGTTEPQALWVFSSDACGLYGLSKLDPGARRSDRSGWSDQIVIG